MRGKFARGRDAHGVGRLIRWGGRCSCWAEREAARAPTPSNWRATSGFDVTFVATAEIGDAEMAERVAEHRRGRPAEWITLEAPQNLGESIRGVARGGALVVDCLSLLVSNLLP